VFDLAIMCGQTKPLKEYVGSDKPLSSADREKLVVFIERLEALDPAKPKSGRPQRKSSYPWNAADAERNAALLVAHRQAVWRKEHGRERVAAAETEGWITEAIEEAAKAFALRAELIKRDNIRSALKSGRIVVP
jgi:hypothetical protein